jgi:hypothetical protein
MIKMSAYRKVFRECQEISEKKSADYGTGNLTRHGIQGIIIRMSDKMSRLENMIKPNYQMQITDETLEDTAKDMINYANYLILMKRGKITKE